MTTWLSDEEVAFKGSGPGEPGHTSTIAIWNLAKGVRTYRENVRTLCAANGTLAYMLDVDERTAFFGTPGQEAPIDYRRVSSVTCQLRTDEADRDRDIVPLPSEHGSLDRGPLGGVQRMDNTPVRLLNKSASSPIEIGLNHWDTAGIAHYAFKSAYLINSQYYDPARRMTSSPWPAGMPRPLWWMTPDGTVTRYQVTAPWNQFNEYFATREGFVAVGTDPRKSGARFPRDAAVFLLRPDGSAETLLQGEAHAVAISPSGCAVAFVYVEAPGKYSSSRLKVLRVCS
ncbi:MAG TPA: hypothetical protein VE907_00540 [Gammaproteobacteria bacterium]|nr:hypothetical protein [Gammaproteobacteria bacterium]